MKKQILFVDDDPFLLRAYGLLLGDERGQWRVWTAPGGKQALELMALEHIDVILADMCMPGMTGVELALEVQKLHPSTSRVIISGLNDKEEVIRCLGTTHQFLPKPFDAKSLRSTLARLGSLDAFLRDERLKGLVANLKSLPSFPSLYMEITRELASPLPSMDRVAAIVEKDPAMTVKILQIVNSAVFGLARQITFPFEAVQFLGMTTVRSLALSLHVFSNFERTTLKGFALDQVWDHSVRTGLLARAIMHSEHASPEEAEDAYVAGMLHDVGKLMLADGMPESFQQAHATAAARGISLSEAEREVLGAPHAGVGAYLLGLWGLPAPIVEAVAFHHEPARSEVRSFSPLTAVHVANVLEHERKSEMRGRDSTGLDANYLAGIGHDDHLEVWRAEAQKLAMDKTN